MHWRFDTLIHNRRKPLWLKALLLPLWLLSLPYGWAVRLRVFLYEVGLRRPRVLPCPVISIGNITVGGTGKTPLTISVAQRLRKQGISVAVLSRGYKGAKTSGAIVSDHTTIYLSPEQSGEEPYLMAQTLKGIPVLVGKNRFLSGQKALQRFNVCGMVLDDGFQHLQLHRDLNILLIDSTIGFGSHRLLPSGILREPLGHLRRAHLVLLTKVRTLESCQPLESRIRNLLPSVPILHSRDEPLGFIGPHEEWDDVAALTGKKVIALSGIANPDPFTFLLNTCGVEVVKKVVFPDHHAYTNKDLALIKKVQTKADWIVTTEKDLVKLKQLNIKDLPLRALRIRVKIWEEAFFYQKVMALFSDKGSHGNRRVGC